MEKWEAKFTNIIHWPDSIQNESKTDSEGKKLKQKLKRKLSLTTLRK